MTTYTKTQLVNLPFVSNDRESIIYNCLMVCSSGEKLDEYPGFFIIGCNSKMEPFEIIAHVEGFRFNGILEAMKTDIIFHMPGDGIFQFWAKNKKISINIIATNLDLDLIDK